VTGDRSRGAGRLRIRAEEFVLNKEIVHTAAAPAAIGPYSQAVKTGLVVFLSGQVGLDPATKELVSEDFEAQVRQAFRNLTEVAKAAGGSLAHAVKFTLFLTDLGKFAKVNEIMAEVVPQPYPARSTIGVASLPKGAQFEVEAILVL
jgi:2-iminobutanoate/2-iminopropanoate deaminase